MNHLVTMPPELLETLVLELANHAISDSPLSPLSPEILPDQATSPSSSDSSLADQPSSSEGDAASSDSSLSSSSFSDEGSSDQVSR